MRDFHFIFSVEILFNRVFHLIGLTILKLFYRYPYNWGLRITNLKPTDAGTYLCQLSTFPPKVRIVYLEIHGNNYIS